MYYNTTNQTGQMLIEFESKTSTQQQMVYNFFKKTECYFSWSELSKYFPDMNEVSLKRCLTDLKNSGKLVKTNEKTISKYGRPAYKYKLAA